MADIEHTLIPISSPHTSPIQRLRWDGILGTDSITIQGSHFGDKNETPGIWEILGFDITIVTDATVANRYSFISNVSTKIGGMTQSGVISVAITASQNIPIRAGRHNVFSNMTCGTTGSYYVGNADLFGIFYGEDEKVSHVLQNGVAGDLYNFEITLRCLNYLWGILPDYALANNPHKAY